uniref:Alkaline phosphatase, tissue-nonspecific isozyme n=1 Tax=Branchiostoma floridae TaxID=7739 RepID=C3YZD8_BRAFL|eukprot:XP_002598197.1 hypothetical protein BRAFLDRAFT_69531 [Branchiostoma floridae]
MARASIDEALRLQTLNTNVAKNVVLFLGDGMGVSTVTTARILKGQKAGNPGEETVLAMDSLPYTAMSKTYNIDKQVPDSAACATAFLCGVKTNFGLLGLDGGATYKNCSSAKGKSTGIVTTTRVTHATPAAGYAHTASRNWEADSDLMAEARENNCTDIAYQLVEEAPDIEVILGGGRRAFLTNNMTDPEDGSKGTRKDGIALIQRWLDRKTGPARYVWNETEFNSVDPKSVDYLLGGRIDHAHHASKAVKALEETVVFDDAVKVAKDMLDTSDSLIVVTADHSHTMTFAGYPKRGHSIFAYKEYRQQSAVPRKTGTHAGEDVIIMADGPMAHLFHGVQEQHYIAHVMMYAACLGEYTHDCDTRTPTVNPRPSRSAGISKSARGDIYAITLITVAYILSLMYTFDVE